MIKKTVKAILAYIAVASLVTLSLFMLEEAFQTTMFGTWPAQDAKRWDLVYNGANLMEKINNTMISVNNWCGWIQPLAFVAYRAYADGADYYIQGLRAKVLAHQPELFIGQHVEFQFFPNSAQKLDGKWVVTNGRVHVEVEKPLKTALRASGVLSAQGEKLWVLQSDTK